MTHPNVQGYCPACGADSLFLAAGGYVTCSIQECPEPDAATSLLLSRAPMKVALGWPL